MMKRTRPFLSVWRLPIQDLANGLPLGRSTSIVTSSDLSLLGCMTVQGNLFAQGFALPGGWHSRTAGAIQVEFLRLTNYGGA